MRFLFLLFIVIPFLEIVLILKVSQFIGIWVTIALVIFTAFLGVTLLRKQGISTLYRAQRKMHEGQIPGKEMAEGVLLAVSGALLLTPGFLTDTVGFLCLVPGFRGVLINTLSRRFVVFREEQAAQQGFSKNSSENTTIEGEYRREE